jgi:rhamnosyltransferase
MVCRASLNPFSRNGLMKLIILLATYNGTDFIEEQIKSIQGQSFKDWLLFIRDDGSTDGTIDKIQAILHTDPRITLLRDGLGNIGVVRNFAELMQKALDAGADYVAFCDQDDVWHADKLTLLLNAARKEEQTDPAMPLLVHSDLEIVDESLHMLYPSFMAHRRIAPFAPQLESVLCQNIVTGCACLINRPLLSLALPVAQGALMHDWWLALLALAYGKIVYVEQPLVRYRQHGKNVIGVQSRLNRCIRWLQSGHNSESEKHIAATVEQAGQLLARISRDDAKPAPGQLQVITRYYELQNLPLLQRLQVLKSYTIVKRSLLADWLFKYMLLRLPVRTAS